MQTNVLGAFGQQTLYVKRNGGVTDDGHLPMVAYSDGTPTVTYGYDNNSQVLTETTGGAGTDVTNTYDSLGEISSVTRASRLVTYSYLHPGQINQIKYPFGNIITRGYDNQGRWNTVTDWDHQTTTFGYDPNGNINTVTDPNGVTTTRVFDSDSQVSQINIVNGTSSIGFWGYTRDQTGDLTSATASGVGGSNSWGYDNAQQIIAQTNTPTETYAYDPAGDPTTLGSQAQAFDAANELCWTTPTSNAGSNRACSTPPTGATTFTYNQNGQRTNQTGTTPGTMSWNAAGELTYAGVGVASSYLYDPNGLRVQQTFSGTYHRYTYDDTTGTPELIGDNSPASNISYLYGPDGLPFEQISHTTSGDVTSWFHQDATTSIRATTNSSGTVTSTESWNPWGKPAATAGTPPTLGYDSQPTDPTGFIYLYHRYYDPATGQFLSVDPLAAITNSRYGYTDNNPINQTDPSGLSWYNPCIGDTCVSDAVSNAAHGINDSIRRFKRWSGVCGIGEPGCVGFKSSDVIIGLSVCVSLCAAWQVENGKSSWTWGGWGFSLPGVNLGLDTGCPGADTSTTVGGGGGIGLGLWGQRSYDDTGDSTGTQFGLSIGKVGVGGGAGPSWVYP